MEQFDEKKYWTWKKMLVILGVMLVLAMVKVFTGPPPPGESSNVGRLKALVDNLEHSDQAVRWQAIVELEKLGPKAKEVAHDIVAYLESNDWRVRYYAAEILGMIGPSAKPAIPALQKALNDPDEKVRARASWALDEISRDTQRNNNAR